MEPVTITLDGREVSGYPGMTILELARESGIEIPTLCYDPHLTSIGACRLCLVENEPTGALLASCVTPIAAGMVINAHSPRVIEHRKTIVTLMLASHPDSCMVCDKGNRCQLRQIASQMDIGLIELQRIPLMAAIQEVNPFIERDLSKCILCAKCIRACQELVVDGAIDYFQRGFTAKPATLNDSPLEGSECTFCGACVALCPTGALMERGRIYRGTISTTVQSTCPFCGCGCSIYLKVKDNHIVGITPDKDDAVSQGALCVRGNYGCDFIHSPDRLTKPLIKVNDGFEETSWEQALEQVATEFIRIKDKHGPDSLAIIGSSKCTNEENYLLQRFARCVLRTNNIDNGSRLYNSATRVGLGSSTGFSGSTNHLGILEQSDVIILIGADPPSSAPVVGYAIKRAVKYRGTKLIVIDPRRTELSTYAHLWLRPEPGTDVALLNGMAKVIIDEGLLDEEFITRKTDDFAALTKILGKYSPESVEAVTGTPGEVIRAAARLYAGASQAVIIYGTGITQSTASTDSVKALANLAILTGHVDHGEGGILALQRENNGQGACDMGTLPDFLPGYQSVTDAQARSRFEKRWGLSLPATSGLTAMEIVEQAKKGTIHGLYIVGENPFLSFPDPNLLSEALASLDFLVVQDMFFTETAVLASVVLPAASFAEKNGTFTNFEGRVGQVNKALKPPDSSLPDWEIVLRIASKMGSTLPYSNQQQIADEIEELVPQYKVYASSEKQPRDEMGIRESKHTYRGQLLKEFARFYPVDYIPAAEHARDHYPFTLLTGTSLYHFGNNTRISRARRLREFFIHDFVEVSEADANKLAISRGESVKVISALGEVTTSVRITDNLPGGTLFMPNASSENPINRLFDINLDHESKTPLCKSCKVRIERVEPHG